jgi:phosphonopyruvate decarboxylase
MISSAAAAEAIERHRGDALVVSTMSALRIWYTISRRRELDLDIINCMSKASSVGLGLALARPERRVLVLDGDGSLLMNLGSLVTIANKAPRNLVHFVFEDGGYTSTGGQPLPSAGGLDLAGLAKEAGYPRTYQFDSLEDFVTALQEILEGDGPTFVCLKVVHDRPLPPWPPELTAREAVYRVREALVGG